MYNMRLDFLIFFFFKYQNWGADEKGASCDMRGYRYPFHIPQKLQIILFFLGTLHISLIFITTHVASHQSKTRKAAASAKRCIIGRLLLWPLWVSLLRQKVLYVVLWDPFKIKKKKKAFWGKHVGSDYIKCSVSRIGSGAASSAWLSSLQSK